MTRRSLARSLPSLVLMLLLRPAAARAQEVILKNDGFTSGGSAVFENGFVTGEMGAARLVPAGPFPMTLTKVQFLFGGAIDTPMVTLHIWDDSAGTDTPGTELFTDDYVLTASDTALQEIDLTAAGISVSGPFRVGIEFLQDAPPSLARDNDGTINAPRNFIYTLGSWYRSNLFGVSGDWIIRAGVVPPAVIFADGFESGDTSAWTTAQLAGGDLSVGPAAKMAGTDYGLQALVNDTAPAFVEDDTPAAEKHYRARFYFDPNGFDPGMAQGHQRTRVFIAFSGNPTRRVAAVVLKRQGSTFSLMARARLDDNTQADTGFVAIADGPHYVELDLLQSSTASASDGSLQLWIDGVPAGSRTGLDNSTTVVDFVRLGALSVKAGAAGTLFWDEFKSTKGASIGP